MANMQPRSFKLDERSITQLKELAEHRRTTQAAVMRQLILGAYNHEIYGIPNCASGSPCLAPAIWDSHLALRQAADARAAAANAATPPPLPAQEEPDGQFDFAPKPPPPFTNHYAADPT